MAINKTLGTVKDQEEERLAVDNFLRNFYTKCSCKDYCYSQAGLEVTLKTYQEYRQLDKKENLIKIGSLLKNMQRPGKGENKYSSTEWLVLLFAKSFFAFIHHTTRRQK